jgi:hypothetical protein
MLEGNNRSASQFTGDDSGTEVTLGVGEFVVGENGLLASSLVNALNMLEGESAGLDFGWNHVMFFIDCVGTIKEGQSKQCTIRNDILVAD